MSKHQQFVEKFPQFCGPIEFFTDDAEQVHFICVETDVVEFTVTVTARCGCCGEIESRERTLEEFFEFMSDSDFAELTETLSNKL